ncbi:hypothetical protein, partial [Salmonella sp. SAL4358]|uniref:hypothetical protein n=1 Tax=Salmonella sp. SAL4358 TaxID=3159879 RepID=UPI00397CF808
PEPPAPPELVLAQSPAGQPIVFHQSVDVQYGVYFSQWSAEGPLTVTAIDPTNGQPGATQFATVYEQHSGHSGPLSSSVDTD